MNPSPLPRLLSYARPHLWLLARAFGCMALLGLTTGAYAYLMGPALRFLLTGGREGLGQVGRLFPSLAQIDRARALWIFPGLVVALGMAKALAYLGQFYWMGLFGQKVSMSLRREVFTHLASLSPRRLSSALKGDLLSRFSADVAAVEVAATYTVASYVRDGLQIAVLVAVALSLHWRLAIVACVLVPVAAVPVSRLTKSFLRKTREGLAQLGNLAGQVQEGLGGLRTLQAFNAQTAELKRFDANALTHRTAMVRAGWVRGAVPGLMEIFGAAAVASALAFAAGRGTLPPESLVSLLTAVVLIYQPAKDLGRVSQFAVQATAAGERLFALLDEAHPVIEPPGALALGPMREGVRIEGLSFQYGDRPALAGLCLEIPSGLTTALVGPSGGGKSTLAALLLRFDAPSSGTITIDGVDVALATVESVRAQFALVTQEPLLFSATVLENLLFARPTASSAEVEAAARVASAHGFIEALPLGYHTPLGERGVVLSGGQRQRICLARAVLANAPVLVLDEATSSLDPQSESEVQAALDEVLPGRTALVIAHRLSTIASAHCIHVIAQGRVVESGSHEALLKRKGLYAQLWSLQQRPAEEGAA